ncbi:unnamed protein product [Closterium sp. NIES-65]|nr:unnamed protein product [Closterium sp. NIES-65]
MAAGAFWHQCLKNCMAAGALPIAHNSAGPKMDIVVPACHAGLGRREMAVSPTLLCFHCLLCCLLQPTTLPAPKWTLSCRPAMLVAKKKIGRRRGEVRREMTVSHTHTAVFPISVPLSALLLLAAHNSAGPKMDIVVPAFHAGLGRKEDGQEKGGEVGDGEGDKEGGEGEQSEPLIWKGQLEADSSGCPVGYLAMTEDEYAAAMRAVFAMSAEERERIATAGREWAKRFSEENFDKSFKDVLRPASEQEKQTSVGRGSGAGIPSPSPGGYHHHLVVTTVTPARFISPLTTTPALATCAASVFPLIFPLPNLIVEFCRLVEASEQQEKPARAEVVGRTNDHPQPRAFATPSLSQHQRSWSSAGWLKRRSSRRSRHGRRRWGERMTTLNLVLLQPCPFPNTTPEIVEASEQGKQARTEAAVGRVGGVTERTAQGTNTYSTATVVFPSLSCPSHTPEIVEFCRFVEASEQEKQARPEAVGRVTGEIVEFCQFVEASEQEKQARAEAVGRVTAVIHSIWAHCHVEVFGSYATGVYLPTSDVDPTIPVHAPDPSRGGGAVARGEVFDGSAALGLPGRAEGTESTGYGTGGIEGISCPAPTQALPHLLLSALSFCPSSGCPDVQRALRALAKAPVGLKGVPVLHPRKALPAPLQPRFPSPPADGSAALGLPRRAEGAEGTDGSAALGLPGRAEGAESIGKGAGGEESCTEHEGHWASTCADNKSHPLTPLLSRLSSHSFPPCLLSPFFLQVIGQARAIGQARVTIFKFLLSFSSPFLSFSLFPSLPLSLPTSPPLQVIGQARVPIIKFLEIESGVSFDISFDTSNGPETAKFIRKSMKAMPALRPISLVLKLFLQQRGLNEVFTGGIGSYALLVMIMAHLQTHHSRFSSGKLEQNLGVLLASAAASKEVLLWTHHSRFSSGKLEQNLGVLLNQHDRFSSCELEQKNLGVLLVSPFIHLGALLSAAALLMKHNLLLIKLLRRLKSVLSATAARRRLLRRLKSVLSATAARRRLLRRLKSVLSATAARRRLLRRLKGVLSATAARRRLLRRLKSVLSATAARRRLLRRLKSVLSATAALRNMSQGDPWDTKSVLSATAALRNMSHQGDPWDTKSVLSATAALRNMSQGDPWDTKSVLSATAALRNMSQGDPWDTKSVLSATAALRNMSQGDPWDTKSVLSATAALRNMRRVTSNFKIVARSNGRRVSTSVVFPRESVSKSSAQGHQCFKQTPVLACPSAVLACPSAVLACPSAVLACPSAVLACPSAVLACPSAVLACPSAVLACPSAVLACPSAVLACPSAVLACPSAVLACPSAVLACPSAVLACPSAVLACPSAVLACPSAVLACPSAVLACPSAVLACPSAVLACPSAVLACPSAVLACPSAVLACPSAVLACPSAVLACPSAVLACPSAVLACPSAVLACPSAVLACPSAVLACPSAVLACPSAVLACPSAVLACPSAVISHPSLLPFAD